MSFRVDTGRFFQTLSAELDAQADRVRNLIGDAHWLSDGHHKEALLQGLIERHLPSTASVSRGFALQSGMPSNCSTEQDLLVLDTSSEAPVFTQSGLVITFPNQVLASLSVKTRFRKQEFADAVTGLLSLDEIGGDGNTIWYGAYFFHKQRRVESTQDIANRIGAYLAALSKKGLRLRNGVRLYVRISNDLFATIRGLAKGGEVNVCQCDGVSTAFFVATLCDSIAHSVSSGRSTFAEALDAHHQAGAQTTIKYQILRY